MRFSITQQWEVDFVVWFLKKFKERDKDVHKNEVGFSPHSGEKQGDIVSGQA